ncbi:MAG: site-specific integrase [Clostridia bacterium]|nr:site-specific integrase [Clostridia bacterium]
MIPFNSSLFSMVHDYFVVYLPEQRNVSPNTIRSYRKTVEELLDYTKEKYHIPLSEVKMEHLTADCILSYLAYLRNERKCSVSTHNTRAAAIRAFLSYVSDRDVTAIHTDKKRAHPVRRFQNISIPIFFVTVGRCICIRRGWISRWSPSGLAIPI